MFVQGKNLRNLKARSPRKRIRVIQYIHFLELLRTSLHPNFRWAARGLNLFVEPSCILQSANENTLEEPIVRDHDERSFLTISWMVVDEVGTSRLSVSGLK